jgi:hypothetical protein
MDRTALLVLLFLAISHGAEARASGRVAAVVPIYVDDQPYSQRCRAAKNPKAIRTPQMHLCLSEIKHAHTDDGVRQEMA